MISIQPNVSDKLAPDEIDDGDLVLRKLRYPLEGEVLPPGWAKQEGPSSVYLTVDRLCDLTDLPEVRVMRVLVILIDRGLVVELKGNRRWKPPPQFRAVKPEEFLARRPQAQILQFNRRVRL